MSPFVPSDDVSQNVSYDVSSTLPDTATAYETGTETLGGGGTISGGSASFTWFDGNALGRDLTITGISATLSITEDSTDTYGFGESGTESITTGGADAPGTVSFAWTQMGTDDYQINEENGSYTLELTDTVSSSWHDDGADLLTDSDSLTGETDSYQWNQLNSVTDNVSWTYGVVTITGGVTDSFSLADSGCESLSANESESGSLTASSRSDQFDIQDAFFMSSGHTANFTGTGTASYYREDEYNFADIGNDSLSGSF